MGMALWGDWGVTLTAGADHGGPEAWGFVLRKPWKGFRGESDGDSNKRGLDTNFVPGTVLSTLQG